MKTKLLVIALIAVFTISFAGDATAARKYKSTTLKPLPAATSTADSQVRTTQQKLAQLGYNPGPADGVSGPQTAEAIRQFQKDRGLDADGIVGPATLAALGL